MADTAKTRNALARQQSGPPTIVAMVDGMHRQVAKTIGSEVGATRFVRNVITVLNTTPKLQDCTPESILGAMMHSAQLRLDPGPLGLVYFIPYGKQCQFQMGYKGYIELAARAGIIITAHEVCEADDFTIEWGSDERVVHRPAVSGDRGDVIGYYAIAKRGELTIGSRYMTTDQVAKHSATYSKTGKDSPWESAFDAMALKTVIKQLASRLPLSVVGNEVAEAAAFDSSILSQHDDGTITADTIEVAGVEVVEDTGEVVKPPWEDPSRMAAKLEPEKSATPQTSTEPWPVDEEAGQ